MEKTQLPERMRKRLEATASFLTTPMSSPLSYNPNIVEMCGNAISKYLGVSGCLEKEASRQFAEAVDIAYMATLEVDEGQSFPFSLVFLPFQNEDHEFHRFERPIDFTSKNISKLAPSLLHTRRAIIFGIIDEELKILGVGPHLWETFQMSSARSGSLSLKLCSDHLDNIRLGFLTKQKFYHNPSIFSCPLHEIELFGGAERDLESFKTRLNFMWEIIRRVYSYQRGAIIVLAGGDRWKDAVSTSNLFNLEAVGEFGKLSESLLSQNIGSAIRSGYSNDIASLSRVDGALILNEGFAVQSFGAKLKTVSNEDLIESYYEIPPGVEPGWAAQVEGTDFQKDIREVGGMRHRSSAQFAYDVRNASVFTVSEDGPISWFFWSKERDSVIKIPNAESFIL